MIHGHAKNGKPSPTYVSWKMMIQRCTNKKREDYEGYGGRGILIYFDWIGPGGFKQFLSDVGERPSKEYSIDRIDPDGNYEPGNVRWATKSQQNANKSGYIIEYMDERLTVYEWADRLGLHPGALRKRFSRMARRGMSRDEILAKALTTPNPHGRRKTRRT